MKWLLIIPALLMCSTVWAKTNPNTRLALNCKASGLAKANGTWDVELYIVDGMLMDAFGNKSSLLKFTANDIFIHDDWFGGNFNIKTGKYTSYEKNIVNIHETQEYPWSTYNGVDSYTMIFNNTCTLTLSPL